MAILDNLETLARWGSKAAALKDTMMRKSIAASAQDSIFQFPCLISDTAPVNMSTTISKYVERVCADFTLITLSQVANVDISLYRTPSQFLRKMHQNMQVESVDSEEDERIIKYAFEEGQMVYAVNEKKGIAFAFESPSDLKRTKKLYELNLEQCREYLSDYDLIPFMEADMTNTDVINALAKSRMDKSSRDRQELAQRISNGHKAPALVDRDIKKTNDLQPYAMQVRLNVINDKNEFVEYWDIIVGVKAVLHLIKSEEMIENIGRTLQNRSAFNGLIRWTTGEISFIKDLMLHINDVKLDMRNMANGYTSWFPTLKRMKEKKVSVNNGRVNQLLPTTTMIITSYEVDEIERRYGIMVKDLDVARRMMKNLFLMGFIILDEGSMTVDVLWDNSKAGFETYALETLQREVALNSNRLTSEIGRMIGSSR